jgi:ribose 5-phosphate isomerase B
MKIIIGADHGGFQLKEEVKNFLIKSNVKFIDIGNHIYDGNDDYPDFAIVVAEKISKVEADKGIIICGSGVGACIAANKFKGVRACVCHDSYSAHQGVEHDDMNILCLGGRIVGIEPAKEIVSAFLQAKFSGEERHKRRLEKVLSLER